MCNTNTVLMLPPAKVFTISADETRLSEIISVDVGDRFVVAMPKPAGRIVESRLGEWQDLANRGCTSDDTKTVA